MITIIVIDFLLICIFVVFAFLLHFPYISYSRSTLNSLPSFVHLSLFSLLFPFSLSFLPLSNLPPFIFLFPSTPPLLALSPLHLFVFYVHYPTFSSSFRFFPISFLSHTVPFFPPPSLLFSNLQSIFFSFSSLPLPSSSPHYSLSLFLPFSTYYYSFLFLTYLPIPLTLSSL